MQIPPKASFFPFCRLYLNEICVALTGQRTLSMAIVDAHNGGLLSSASTALKWAKSNEAHDWGRAAVLTSRPCATLGGMWWRRISVL